MKKEERGKREGRSRKQKVESGKWREVPGSGVKGRGARKEERRKRKDG
ncbi:MAG: hypothetical protein ACM3QS_12550 [Bacteroidota bacterium]